MSASATSTFTVEVGTNENRKQMKQFNSSMTAGTIAEQK